MPVDAAFSAEVEMPEGKKNLLFILKSQGTLLSGSVEGPFGKYSFNNGTFSHNNFDMAVNLKSGNEKKQEELSRRACKGFFRKIGRFLSESLSGPPLGMPSRRWPERPKRDMPVEFSGRVEGDVIYGRMKFGDYATGKFRGSRVDPESGS